MSKVNSAQRPDRESAGDASDLTKNEIFDLLRNQRRRFVLHYLKTRESTDESVELGDLATVVAAWENAIHPSEVSSAQRKRVYTTLQQSHLPKMDEVGIIDFDSSRGVITPTEYVNDLTIYLEIVPDHEFAWHEYYLGLGAVCTALMAAVWVGIFPFTFAPPIIWGTVISAAITASAGVHLYTQRDMGIGDGEVPQEVDFDDVD